MKTKKPSNPKQPQTGKANRKVRSSGLVRQINETYYAVMIGDPRRHSPYLMIDPSVRDCAHCGKRLVPGLYTNREDAEETMPAQTCTRVVRVRITRG